MALVTGLDNIRAKYANLAASINAQNQSATSPTASVGGAAMAGAVNSAANTPAPTTTPAPTASTTAPTTNYGGKGNPLNEILYSKQQYDAGNKNWASDNAKQYYGQLSPEEAKMVQGMNTAQLTAYINSKNAPASTDTSTSGPAAVDPFGGLLGADATSARDAGYRGNASTDAATAQAENMKKYQQVIDALTGQRGYDLETLKNQLADSKNSLEDQTFQNWLATRQNMADRGMAGTGLATDANTRLQLARQGQLASLMKQNQTDSNNIINKYGAQIQQASQDQANSTNFDELMRKYYQTYAQQGESSALDQAKLYMDLYKSQLPYQYQTADNAANNAYNYTKLGTDTKFNYDKLGVDTKYNYDKLGVDAANNMTNSSGYLYGPDGKPLLDPKGNAIPTAQNKQFYDSLAQQWATSMTNASGYIMGADGKPMTDAKGNPMTTLEMQKFLAGNAIDWTKVMGVDAQGNPTIDSRKLAEEIRHNGATETTANNRLTAEVADWTAKNTIATGRLTLDQASLAQKTAYDAEMIKKAQGSLQNDADKTKLSGFKTQLDAVSKRLAEKTAKLKVGDKLPDNDPDVQAYNTLMNSINDVLTGSASGK